MAVDVYNAPCVGFECMCARYPFAFDLNVVTLRSTVEDDVVHGVIDH